MLRILTAREQVQLLSPWLIIATNPHQPQVERYKELLKRHLYNRNPVEGRRPELPPLARQEKDEFRGLMGWRNSLNERWHNADFTLTPDEEEAHRAMYPKGHKVPEEMSDRQRANYYADLHLRGPEGPFADADDRTPREKLHYRQMHPWAEQHFGNMQNDAQDELERWNDYASTGRHPGGSETLKLVEGNHHPDLTGAWAAEVEASGEHPHLTRRAEDYHDALQKVAQHGPFQLDYNTMTPSYESLEKARNAMRVELQHKQQFSIPETDELSRHDDPDNKWVTSNWAINPRHLTGTGMGTDQRHQDAYKVNCQRCAIAADARYRGYNVEAQRNLKGMDMRLNDHAIAQMWQHPNGDSPRWMDAEDNFINHPKGPELWDMMDDHISRWGPGAHGVVTMSYPNPGVEGDHLRHIINVSVNDDGVPEYRDHQVGGKLVGKKWREKVGYDLHPENQSIRQEVMARGYGGLTETASINHNPSPLRYMRTDDLELHPRAGKFMVDRGSAPHDHIIAPKLEESALPQGAR